MNQASFPQRSHHPANFYNLNQLDRHVVNLSLSLQTKSKDKVFNVRRGSGFVHFLSHQWV